MTDTSEERKMYQRVNKGFNVWVNDRDWTEDEINLHNLRQTHPNEWVAVYQEKVVTHAPKQEDLYKGQPHPNRESYYVKFLPKIVKNGLQSHRKQRKY